MAHQRLTHPEASRLSRPLLQARRESTNTVELEQQDRRDSALAERLRAAFVGLGRVQVGAALSSLDLRAHTASHPRLGVVDHISCHPLLQPSDVHAAAEVSSSS